MKAYLVAVVMVLCHAAASASGLAAANAALQAKSYAEAIRLYTPLAEAGNAEAQFHLGEMHWYGEGLRQDNAQARAWFEKSAAAGHAAARSALDVMQQRGRLKSDIDFYVSQYDGADLAFSPQQCPAPVFPSRSERKGEIRRTEEAYLRWLDCYNNFVATLNEAMPPGKLIPARIANIMNEQEFTAAQARMDQAYARLSAEARQLAEPVQAQHDAWLAKTEEFVALEAQRFLAAQSAADAAVRRRANTDLLMQQWKPIGQRREY
jgi:uncharacterized protein